MRRILLALVTMLCTLGVSPPAHALSARYELDWPANCLTGSGCLRPVNVTSAFLQPGGRILVTVHASCRAPIYAEHVEMTVVQPSTGAVTGKLVDPICDGVKRKYRFLGVNQGPQFKVGRVNVEATVEWQVWPSGAESDETLLDPVKVTRP